MYFFLQTRLQQIAANVRAAWRGWRLTEARAGYKTCKFAQAFGRATPPLTPNRQLHAGSSVNHCASNVFASNFILFSV